MQNTTSINKYNVKRVIETEINIANILLTVCV